MSATTKEEVAELVCLVSYGSSLSIGCASLPALYVGYDSLMFDGGVRPCEADHLPSALIEYEHRPVASISQITKAVVEQFA